MWFPFKERGEKNACRALHAPVQLVPSLQFGPLCLVRKGLEFAIKRLPAACAIKRDGPWKGLMANGRLESASCGAGGSCACSLPLSSSPTSIRGRVWLTRWSIYAILSWPVMIKLTLVLVILSSGPTNTQERRRNGSRTTLANSYTCVSVQSTASRWRWGARAPRSSMC